VALVDVGVRVDQARQHHAAVEVEPRRPVARRSRWHDRRNAAVIHTDVACEESIGVRRSVEKSVRLQDRGGNPGVT